MIDNSVIVAMANARKAKKAMQGSDKMRQIIPSSCCSGGRTQEMLLDERENKETRGNYNVDASRLV